jgi:hypothetical protein
VLRAANFSCTLAIAAFTYLALDILQQHVIPSIDFSFKVVPSVWWLDLIVVELKILLNQRKCFETQVSSTMSNVEERKDGDYGISALTEAPRRQTFVDLKIIPITS